MSQTLFISDLHLDPGRPQIIELAARFLHDEARHSDALYILGDLFEYWIGDDQPINGLEPVLEALQQLKSADIPVYFIAGNRDFLVGETFANNYGISLLPDSTIIDLYGTPTLIMHGDTLCTDDVRYQELRAMLRNPQWQAQFLGLPLQERIQQALALREQSASETGEKSEMIMDVNPDTVANEIQASGTQRLIHGHTHRPGIHHLTIGNSTAERIVLGDWYKRGCVLRCNPDSCTLDEIA